MTNILTDGTGSLASPAASGTNNIPCEKRGPERATEEG
jgi:hypothetical protein